MKKAIQFIQKEHYQNLVDIGTGTGIIPISIARKCPEVNIFALDISPDALDLAHQNAEKLGFSKQIHFLQSDVLENLPEIQ